jgi:hypothetical protein
MNFSLIISLVSLGVGLIAFPSYFLGRRARQLPDIRYAIDFDIILDPDDRLLDQDLQMTVGDRQIKSISRTRLAFWNQRDTVRGADIVGSDPIRLQFVDGDTPLQVRTLTRSRSPIGLCASINSIDPTCVDISFDFLDARDGAIFEIVHQGVQSPKLVGTLRGATLRKHDPSNLTPKKLAVLAKRPWYRRISKSAVGLTVFSLAVACCAAAVTWLAFYYQAPAGSLITAHRFNLNSMRGQANFANAVFNSNNPYAPSGAIGFYLFILCIFLIVFTITAISNFIDVRKQIPYNIAQEEL